MRKLISVALLAVVSLPASARVTVKQLEDLLTRDHAAQKTDSEVARQIRPLELSERLTESSMTRITSTLNLGAQTIQALQLIADQSSFLDPPGNEILPGEPPDDATRKRMLDAARSYVVQTLARMPNLLATRITDRFDDTPQALSANGWPVHAGLHFVDTSSTETSIYSDLDTLSSKNTVHAKPATSENGLTSWGEFGPMLAMILSDTDKGSLSWNRWEQLGGVRVAVFHYVVPKASSHYAVSGFRPQHTLVEHSAPYIKGFGMTPGLDVAGSVPYRIIPGYHGLLWLDPATGTILRLTVEADLKDRDPVKVADLLVQYEPIAINGRNFVCPVRSLALRRYPVDPNDTAGTAPTLMLNVTVYVDYHRFTSSVRILDPSAKN
jgi:hypothetical protein